ncbi:MAG: shikimate dehydrogenase [Cytophagaceae bacterium]|jgi:shikimate dehydrogenase|nr:shikimate dehydrogenase [Cytophagaceae bacterium]
MEALYGLIGFPLTHSFSKKYFTEKFEREQISGHRYELFEMKTLEGLKSLISEHPDLRGLNVTIPHKEKVLELLDEIDPAAQKMGAVNVIKISGGHLKGYNSDFFGFKKSLENLLGGTMPEKALILGTGGASKAVKAALEALGISYTEVSSSGKAALSYDQLTESVIGEHRLLINTTPLGMYPKGETFPQLPYEAITSSHFAFDLVYNPLETTFMRLAAARGAQVANGLEMLHLQAEKAWEIWNA